MPAKSAGVLAYRTKAGRLEVLLVHPGGPYWANKDDGAWSIPKGEYGAGESPEGVARREFAEELGVELSAALEPLGEIRQRGGKVVTAFAAAFDVDVTTITSNTFEIEWPPRSGKRQSFPEVDRAVWFALVSAREKINAAQREFLKRLAAMRGKP
ncbi:NUDIX domain-containing protein [Bradyrhizobium sp. Tv2a-2]|uniref:NUDIX domain-containing protein n=1 Tax=Bradyrhizobium sp. Tv2a-2 TaxID=113395 RepID=UPI00040F8436|nr:NUDIX domain-containing protein [Bradyrhizobium sp. Tv2a-2]